ncbi:MAG: hypothetical protein IKI49_00545 [Oscillospiraceae bacterium]|nr:hypothetical protein [Oscillospiraceae bacterium]
MACFLVPAAEALVAAAVKKGAEKKETNNAKASETATEGKVKIPFSVKLKWLGRLLWGGSALLAFEHVWHGEIVPWFPFLTAASDPAGAAEMLREMATVGVGMAVLITLVWLVMCRAAERIVNRRDADDTQSMAEQEG